MVEVLAREIPSNSNFLFLRHQVMKIINDLQTGVKIRQNKIRLNETHDSSYYGGFWGKDDFGTSHTSILTKEGDAISTTNTINT